MKKMDKFMEGLRKRREMSEEDFEKDPELMDKELKERLPKELQLIKLHLQPTCVR